MNAKLTLTALCLSLSGLAFGASAAESDNPMPEITKGTSSRAEVLADLALWKRAGVPEYMLESGPDFANPKYREAFARYESLRNSAEYAREVDRIARARGERLSLASGG
ncbi:MAG: DUF4148 domain-containing protein [Pigmentiphaga sp.]|uniref:DUF4148 domain-containing protein n=1 Tax=Pigmentiphaga sp. TaxID=1977564 RepID=UPI0029BA0225|nr:DUF4148 domain-containing protein [Pigmentiphaga sp.]MDX3904283.1 DUF4148 domain-containing protein [Pigmentiphaga sp.]